MTFLLEDLIVLSLLVNFSAGDDFLPRLDLGFSGDLLSLSTLASKA